MCQQYTPSELLDMFFSDISSLCFPEKQWILILPAEPQQAKQGRRVLLLLPVPSLSPYTASSGSLWLEAILSQQTPGNSWECPHSWPVGPPCSSGWLAGNGYTGSDNICKNQRDFPGGHYYIMTGVLWQKPHTHSLNP